MSNIPDRFLQRKPLIVGPARGRKFDPDLPAFQGPCSKRMAAQVGVSVLGFYELFETTNLVHRWPGHRPDMQGDHIRIDRRADLRIEMEAQARMIKRLCGPRYVVCCGVDVWDLMTRDTNVNDVETLNGGYFKLVWDTSSDNLLVCVPHPSGLNRWWNDRNNVELAGANFRLIRQVAESSVSMRTRRVNAPI